MRLSDLIYEDEYFCEKSIPRNIEITEIAARVEELTENSLFILIESIKYDVKNIINYIKTRPPKIIVCDKKLNLSIDGSYVLYVKNPRKIMAHIYSRFYSIDYSKFKSIGITGTNGKTSTATLLYKILRFDGNKTGFIGTGKIEIDGTAISDETYSMTTPDPKLLYSSIKKMEEENCKYIVMEISSHALFFDKIAPIPIEIGMFTNLSAEHLDFHENVEEYYKCKLKLFDQCKIGIFNNDDPYSRRAGKESSCKIFTVGILWSSDVMAREISQESFHEMSYIYKESCRIFKVKLSLVGAYNIYNSMFAIKAAILLGVRPCVAKRAVFGVRVEGRFEIIEDGITIIIDYAHTSFALENLLKSINSLKKSGQKLTLVFGCGGNRDRYKRPQMAKIAEKYADFSIVTSDNSRDESESQIISDILEGFSKTENRKVISSRKNAIEYAILNSKEDEIIAVVGKGHERYNIDKNGVHYFDEREIIRVALEKKKQSKGDFRCE